MAFEGYILLDELLNFPKIAVETSFLSFCLNDEFRYYNFFCFSFSLYLSSKNLLVPFGQHLLADKMFTGTIQYFPHVDRAFKQWFPNFFWFTDILNVLLLREAQNNDLYRDWGPLELRILVDH
jgi:hypothetical protein